MVQISIETELPKATRGAFSGSLLAKSEENKQSKAATPSLSQLQGLGLKVRALVHPIETDE